MDTMIWRSGALVLAGTFTVSKVPRDKLQHQLAMWNMGGATQIGWKEDGDGTYTVTAVYPPCPDDTNHEADSKAPARS